MLAVLLMVALFVGYIAAYHTYGRFLARRIFRLREVCNVPSREFEDGIDYVPTSRGVVFGHHFTSVAGTGPIVGPAIAIIWGWLPAVLWVFLGNILMGAVHDFGALVVSLRNQGRSISDIAARYINPRVQTILFLVVFLELLIVVAVFGLVIALLLDLFPKAVFPVWAQIPIAVALGWAIRTRRGHIVAMTAAAVAAMYVTVILGAQLPDLRMPGGLAVPPTGLWAVLLFVYCFIASTLPVTTLLQPRDYMNAWQLVVAMGLLTVGVVASGLSGELHMVAPAFDPSPAGAPALWPTIFIIIACGAISGFHCLVASGTSSKQLASEQDALPVGYGSMLLEGALAVLVIVAVGAGIGMFYRTGDGQVLQGLAAWKHHYASWGAAEGLKANVDAFVSGSANMVVPIGIPRELATVVMGVFVASFAGTTLDTATRLQRYVIGELAQRVRLPSVGNRWVATTLAVVTAGALAFSTGMGGKGARLLWPMFGALNQLLAALALLVVTVYLRRKGGLKFLATALPCLFMLVMTLWAMVLNEIRFIDQGLYLLAVVNLATVVLACWMVAEVLVLLSRFRRPIVDVEDVPAGAP